MRDGTKRLGWFVGIWAASVAVLTVVGGLIKWVLS